MLSHERQVQVVRVVEGWSEEERLGAAIEIMHSLVDDGVIPLDELKALTLMAKGPCDALLMNLVEKDPRLGLVGSAALIYLLDTLRLWVEGERKRWQAKQCRSDESS